MNRPANDPMTGHTDDPTTGQTGRNEAKGQTSGQEHTRVRSRGLWRLCGGLIVWASCFAMMYGAQAAGCSAGLETHTLLGANGVTVMLLAIWGAHLAGLSVRLARERRNHSGASDQTLNVSGEAARPSEDTAFFSGVGRILTVVALLATLWTGFAIVLLPPCL